MDVTKKKTGRQNAKRRDAKGPLSVNPVHSHVCVYRAATDHCPWTLRQLAPEPHQHVVEADFASVRRIVNRRYLNRLAALHCSKDLVTINRATNNQWLK